MLPLKVSFECNHTSIKPTPLQHKLCYNTTVNVFAFIYLIFANHFCFLLCFIDQDYAQAIELYTKAIELFPSAVYYANRSISCLRTEAFGYALSDASKAIELDTTYLKGYYRRAAAYMSLGKFKQALKDFETVRYAIKLTMNERTLYITDFGIFALKFEISTCENLEK